MEDNAPAGCLGCNPEEIQPMLDEHGIKVEAIPVPEHAATDVIVCPKCGQAWLMMPRKDDPSKPVA